MAIVIEEEKRKINWGFILGAFMVVILIGLAAIYLFFVNPSQVEVFISPQLESLTEFNKINFNPEELLNNQAFRSLKSLVEFKLPSGDMIGKSNPFSL